MTARGFSHRGQSMQALLQASQPSAAVLNAAQLGGQAKPLRLGDVVLLYAQYEKSYVFSDISRYATIDLYASLQGRSSSLVRKMHWLPHLPS